MPVLNSGCHQGSCEIVDTRVLWNSEVRKKWSNHSHKISWWPGKAIYPDWQIYVSRGNKCVPLTTQCSTPFLSTWHKNMMTHLVTCQCSHQRVTITRSKHSCCYNLHSINHIKENWGKLFHSLLTTLQYCMYISCVHTCTCSMDTALL